MVTEELKAKLVFLWIIDVIECLNNSEKCVHTFNKITLESVVASLQRSFIFAAGCLIVVFVVVLFLMFIDSN